MDVDDCLRRSCQSMQELSLTFVIDGDKEANPTVLVPMVHHFDREITVHPKDDIKPKMTLST